MSKTNKQKTFIYITGFGRSGSSIFDMYLAKRYGFFSSGELTYFFERGIVNKELCSCGQNVFNCKFWSNVIEEFGKEELIKNASVYAKTIRKFESTKSYFLYRYFNNIWKSKYFKQYIDINKRLLKSIYKVLGDDTVLIDSSKFPSRGLWFLKYIAQDLNINMYIIHIIRHPAANAYSWTKKKLRPEASYNGKEIYMSQFNYYEALLKWLNNNLAASNLKTLTHRYALIKYENFCKNPEKVISSLLKEWGLTYKYGENPLGYHSISGNPARFYNKNLEIKCNKEWMTKVKGLRHFSSNLIKHIFKAIDKEY